MKSDAIIGAVQGVTKKWAKQRKAEERAASAAANRRRVMTQTYRFTMKDAAWDCMEEAYLKASGGGRLPANARQIYYQARPLVQAATGERLQDQYFIQNLLPSYLAEHAVNWDVVYDERGHFEEPHTEETVGLGTLAVRAYLHNLSEPSLTSIEISSPKVETSGPTARYGAVLFIEKEGFDPLFKEAKLAERYDLAIMSTKGLSNVASRRLVDEICGGLDIPLFVLHDFDKAGFSILGTLQRSTERYYFRHRCTVIDLGLRLEDVQRLGLDAEASYDRGSEWSIRANLRRNGATQEEIEFLLNERVELNALPSDTLVEWIESKLKEHGVEKIVPKADFLIEAYRHTKAVQFAEEKCEKLIEKARQHGEEAEVPDDLADRVNKLLQENPELPWDKAIQEIANSDADEDDDVGDDE